MGYKNYDELEITVSIKDMIMRICLKWRQMLAWGIVLAVLFNCVGILKSYNAVQASKNSNVLTWEEQIDKKIESAQSKTEEWYQYLDSGIIYNVWGVDCMLHADSDYDGDIVMTTDNESFVNCRFKDEDNSYIYTLIKDN